MITNEMLDAYDTAILNHSPRADHTCDCGQKFKTTGDWHDHKISTALAAAAPHLRAAWEQELARAVKRLPWNGVTHGGTMVPLDAVLALLEGGRK